MMLVRSIAMLSIFFAAPALAASRASFYAGASAARAKLEWHGFVVPADSFDYALDPAVMPRTQDSARVFYGFKAGWHAFELFGRLARDVEADGASYSAHAVGMDYLAYLGGLKGVEAFGLARAAHNFGNVKLSAAVPGEGYYEWKLPLEGLSYGVGGGLQYNFEASALRAAIVREFFADAKLARADEIGLSFLIKL